MSRFEDALEAGVSDFADAAVGEAVSRFEDALETGVPVFADAAVGEAAAESEETLEAGASGSRGEILRSGSETGGCGWLM